MFFVHLLLFFYQSHAKSFHVLFELVMPSVAHHSSLGDDESKADTNMSSFGM